MDREDGLSDVACEGDEGRRWSGKVLRSATCDLSET